MMSDELIKWFYPIVTKFVSKRVNDADDVKDLVQDVFIKVHLNLKHLKSPDHLERWIYQITRNTLADFYRKKHSAWEAPDLISPHDNEHILTKEVAEYVGEMMSQLAKEAKDALYATEITGLSQKEYAANRGLTYSTIKSRVQRARQQLRRAFDRCCKVEADIYGNILEITPEKKCGC